MSQLPDIFQLVYPDGKPLYPMDEKEFNDYLEFTHAVNTAEKIEKRRQKKAASDALNEIIKDPLTPESDDDEPEETSEKDKEKIPEKPVIKPNAKKPCFKPDDVSKSKDTDLGR